MSFSYVKIRVNNEATTNDIFRFLRDLSDEDVVDEILFEVD